MRIHVRSCATCFLHVGVNPSPAYRYSLPRLLSHHTSRCRHALQPPGAPAPGLDYLDWLSAAGALRCAPVSFPRMGRAAGGLATCEAAAWGDTVLHVFCGAGALTKLLASQGLQVRGWPCCEA